MDTKKQYGFIYVDHKNHNRKEKRFVFIGIKEVIATRGENIITVVNNKKCNLEEKKWNKN